MKLAGLAACAVATLAAASALAAPPMTLDHDGREAARKFAERGLELFEAGDCKGAIASFESAEKSFHAPPHGLYLARCDAKLGRLLEARRRYRAIVDEKLSEAAPEPFRKAQASAKGELDDVEIRLPTVEMAVRAGEAGPVAVTLDGAPVAAASLRKGVQIDPGPHTLGATGPSGQQFARLFQAKDGGGSTKIEVSFGAVAPQGSYIPAIIAFSVGGVGLVAGIITGVGSLSKVSDLNAQCDAHVCGGALQPTADSAKTLGTISTIGFITAGVGAAAGVTLLVLKPKLSSAPTVAKLTLQPGSLRFGGTF